MRLLVIAHKELLQLRRDRLTLAMMVVMPVMMLLLFGYGINTDVRHIPTVVFDQDGSPQSRDLARSMEATGFYRMVGQVTDYDEVRRAFRSGTARVALVIPPRYSAHLHGGRTAQVQLVVDGSDPQTVASATSTAASLVAARSGELSAVRLARAGAAAPPAPIELEPTIWYNPDLRSAIYIVPGLVGVILTLTMVMLTAMAIVRERERGTLEQLIVSPVKTLELMGGKILPYVVMGYVQMSLILVAGHLVFGVPFGALGLLYAMAFVFIAASLAVGILFSTMAKNQQQAMQMSFFFLLPNILLSGFMFPWEGMPAPAQWLSQGLPLTHFLRIVRGLVLRGSGAADLAGEVAALAIILAVLVLLASLRFSKRLD